MLTSSPPEMLICCLCEKRPGVTGNIPIPLCLRCRTENYEQAAAAEPKSVTVFSNPTGPDLLIRKGQTLIASG